MENIREEKNKACKEKSLQTLFIATEKLHYIVTNGSIFDTIFQVFDCRKFFVIKVFNKIQV